jgi:hypothetical protein
MLFSILTTLQHLENNIKAAQRKGGTDVNWKETGTEA